MSVSQGNIVHRPVGKVDSQFQLNQYSFNDGEMRGDNNSTTNLVYVGWAKTGASTALGVWQIRFITYDTNGNVLSIKWPLNANGAPSSDYEFTWDSRTTYTFV